jgi:hypothetical protein
VGNAHRPCRIRKKGFDYAHDLHDGNFAFCFFKLANEANTIVEIDVLISCANYPVVSDVL